MKTKLTSLLFLLFLSGCASKNQAVLDFALEAPKARTTGYSTALYDLGQMLDVYIDDPIFIQSKDILDSTGVSNNSFSEIPYNITEIIKSSLNKIGEKVVFIPYDPTWTLNEIRLGSTFKRPLPHLVLTGAITEYDRTLASNGESANLASSFGGGDWITDVGLDGKRSSTMSRLTIDLNLLNYTSQTMLPQIQSINSVMIRDKTESESLSFAIHGTGFGIDGVMRQVQGRHAAVRLLSELSVLEIIGKVAGVPYWRCVPGTEEDVFLIRKVEKHFVSLDEKDKVSSIKELLTYYGYPNTQKEEGFVQDDQLSITDYLNKTQLKVAGNLDPVLYTSLYLNMPYKN
jgi:hypothetical protein